MLEPHSGSRAHFVEQHLAVVGHKRLHAVYRRKLVAQHSETLFDIVQTFSVFAEFRTEIPAKSVFGSVVLGGTQSTGNKHYVGVLQSAVEDGDDGVGLVGDGKHLRNVEIVVRQAFGHPCGIGVHHLPDKQLVANGYYCTFASCI